MVVTCAAACGSLAARRGTAPGYSPVTCDVIIPVASGVTMRQPARLHQTPGCCTRSHGQEQQRGQMASRLVLQAEVFAEFEHCSLPVWSTASTSGWGSRSSGTPSSARPSATRHRRTQADRMEEALWG